VLLVSTDPASNLDAVMETQLSGEPTPVPGAPGLDALNIDPEAAAREYREQTVAPYRGVLPDETVKQMEEQLAGACAVEIAAFDRFARLLGNTEANNPYDHVVLDTAPTGHTLRLLQLPAAWSGFLETNTSGASCLGPLSGLESQRTLYANAANALANGSMTTLVLVARPERSALEEASRTSAELAALGVTNQRLVVNGVFRASEAADPIAVALERQGREALATMPASLRTLPDEQIPLLAHDLIGVPVLRALVADREQTPRAADAKATQATLPSFPPLAELVDEIAAAGHGVVMVMGKGGVGKTTLAAAIALELAHRGLPVHLTTTDPAGNVGAVVDGEAAGLTLSRIDPKIETRAYVEHVLATAGANLDRDARSLLEEDLRSPCTEEIAVFQAFSHKLSEAQQGFVVLDTAPTGHSLLLLDATGAYHREVMRNAAKLPGRVVTPLLRLQDPHYTRVLIVTIPEVTPVLEAAQLQEDLRRAGIEPFAWVLNRSLAAAAPMDRLLATRAQAEIRHVDRVRASLARRVALVPWQAEEPIGLKRLRNLTRR